LPGAPDFAVHVFQNEELGPWPREMAVGSRRLISQEAAAEWRKAREAAA
jgi:hypothetical protein